MKKHHEIVPLVQTKMDVKGSYIECRQQHRKKIADDVPSSQKKKKKKTKRGSNLPQNKIH